VRRCVCSASSENDADRLAQIELAAQDPLFLADIKDTMDGFKSADADWWKCD
jgi:hypothetical protein